MEKKFEFDFKVSPMTKEEQDEAFREFDAIQQRSLERFFDAFESDPKLRAQCEAARIHAHREKFGHVDFSPLEERAVKGTQTGRATSDRSNLEEVSPTILRSSGTMRSVVYSRPISSDNIPRDGRLQMKKISGERMRQTDIHLGDAETCDIGHAMAAVAYGLTGKQLGVSDDESVPNKHQDYIDEAPFISGSGCPVGPSPSGRALRIDKSQTWSAERRDRAATSASVRKKLRTKTRAQKKARRKQR